MTITKGKLGKEDIKLWDGISPTFNRPTSTGGVDLYSKIDWAGVDVLHVFGDGWTKTDRCINDAIVKIGSRGACIWLQPGTWTLSANVTIPATMKLVVPYGAVISGAYTLTINGGFEGSPGCFASGLSVVHRYAEPEWWGINTTPGSTDMAYEIQEAVDCVAAAGGGVVQFRGETYSIGTGISKSGSTCSKITLKGKGSRATIIQASAAIEMFTLAGSSTSALKPNVNLEQLQIDGNDLATIGVSFSWMHFWRWDDVVIQNVAGTGLDIKDCEDGVFDKVDVRSCGVYATSTNAAQITFDAGAGYAVSNSITFQDCTLERNRYTALYLQRLTDGKLRRCKFHGRLTTDDATPDSIDLLQLDGPDRCSIIGNQFVHIRRRGINIMENVNTTPCTIQGNTFEASADYAAAGVLGFILIDSGFHYVDGNIFLPPTSDITTYGTTHDDIKITVNAIGAVGTNIHNGDPNIKLVNNATGMQPVVIDGDVGTMAASEYLMRAASTDNIINSLVNDGVTPESYARFTVGVDGEMTFGGGAGALDLTLKRSKANILSVGSGDGIGVGNTVSNTNSPSGNTTRAWPVYNHVGDLIGYVPIYAAQW